MNETTKKLKEWQTKFYDLADKYKDAPSDALFLEDKVVKQPFIVFGPPILPRRDYEKTIKWAQKRREYLRKKNEGYTDDLIIGSMGINGRILMKYLGSDSKVMFHIDGKDLQRFLRQYD